MQALMKLLNVFGILFELVHFITLVLLYASNTTNISFRVC